MVQHVYMLTLVGALAFAAGGFDANAGRSSRHVIWRLEAIAFARDTTHTRRLVSPSPAPLFPLNQRKTRL